VFNFELLNEAGLGQGEPSLLSALEMAADDYDLAPSWPVDCQSGLGLMGDTARGGRSRRKRRQRGESFYSGLGVGRSKETGESFTSLLRELLNKSLLACLLAIFTSLLFE
jgi:hypothetical protein